MTRIQLLVNDERERTALRALLSQQYDVAVDDDLRDADAYVVGDKTLPSYRDELRAHKHTAHPTFVPVVLIKRARTQLSLSVGETDTRDGPPLLDEVVSAPVDKAILYRRLDNLLVRRNQSVVLTRQHEASLARFQALLDAIPDPAFVLDETETLTRVNDGFCDAVGHVQRKVVGRAVDDIPGLGLEPEALVEQASDTSGAATAPTRTVELTDSDGNTRHTVLSARNVHIEGTACTVGVLTDVTELKRKTERLEEFASVVAHDLRNPLQVAQGRLELITEEFPNANDHTAPIARSHDRIRDLTQKLLTVAKTGKTKLQYEEVSLSTCVQRAWENVYTHDATLTPTGIEDVTLEGDTNRLLQLLENLFRNAIEHGGQNTVLRVGILDDGFYVEDDGPGIPSDSRDNVLRMGYSTEQGNGLGLSIVEEIVDAHNWTLALAESGDGGARFEIRDVPEIHTSEE